VYERVGEDKSTVRYAHQCDANNQLQLWPRREASPAAPPSAPQPAGFADSTAPALVTDRRFSASTFC
jgi:hypothetical protein